MEVVNRVLCLDVCMIQLLVGLGFSVNAMLFSDIEIIESAIRLIGFVLGKVAWRN